MSIFGSIMSAIFKSATPAATPPGESPSPATTTAPATGGPQGSAASATLDRADVTDVSHSPPVAPPTATPDPVDTASRGSAATTALDRVDVEAVLTKLAAQNSERLDWRRSIVDLMKLLNLDSSLAARKQLARELHYTGDTSDSAAMNIWLHRQVMQKLAENGGKVPADLSAR